MEMRSAATFDIIVKSTLWEGGGEILAGVDCRTQNEDESGNNNGNNNNKRAGGEKAEERRRPTAGGRSHVCYDFVPLDQHSAAAAVLISC